MTSFSELGLSAKVLKAIELIGYKQPTPIQQKAIPYILERNDVLGIAQTGTGKTASFVLPILTLLEQGRRRARMPRVLILEPTRELADQVSDNFQKYGAYHKLDVAMLIGGVSFEEQENMLKRGVDVIIATPGRLLDLFSRGKLMFNATEILVIDEADRMLDMGFIPDIEQVVKLLPFTRQTLFFSATMAGEISKLTEKFLHNHALVEVTHPRKTAKTIEQKFIKTGPKPWDKRALLRKLFQKEQDDVKNAIIFCNQKRGVSELFRSCLRHNLNVGALHGDMDQYNRRAMLSNFKTGKLKYLIASDVAARGLDIAEVSHVFNFDVPINAEDYIHRIGRTGRAGRLGKAFTLVTEREEKNLQAIAQEAGIEINWLNLAAPSSSVKEKSANNSPSSKPKEAALSDKAAKANNTERSSKASKAARDVNKAANKESKKDKQGKEAALPKQNRQVLGFGNNIPAFMLIDLS